jgi:hypothetical protein
MLDLKQETKFIGLAGNPDGLHLKQAAKEEYQLIVRRALAPYMISKTTLN